MPGPVPTGALVPPTSMTPRYVVALAGVVFPSSYQNPLLALTTTASKLAPLLGSPAAQFV